MKTDRNQPVVGKFLNGRYKVVQILSAGTYGRTYLAEDSWPIADRSQRTIKHFQPEGNDRQQWQIYDRLFANEAEILKKLENHDRIPQLLDCFEDYQGFYLVQEAIAAEPLSAELPTDADWGNCWSELQCIELLQEVLDILEFVHSYGIVHGNLTPQNLLRRTSDRKLVLIDFGAARQIERSGRQRAWERGRNFQHQRLKCDRPSPPYPCSPLENADRLSTQPCPSHDLYALGLIAIKALTGRNPSQLYANPNTGQVNWQQQVSVSESLAGILNRLVRYDFKDCYQSATDIRIELKRLVNRSEEKQVSKEDLFKQFDSEFPSVIPPQGAPTDTEDLELCIHSVSPLPNNCSPQPLSYTDSFSSAQQGEYQESSRLGTFYYARELVLSFWPKLPPLVSGVGAGMATTNAVAISLGLYSLMHGTVSSSGLDVLAKAAEQYRAGNFDKAIALASSIPSDSPAYQDSLTAIQEWRDEWDLAAAQYQAVEDAFNEGRWRDAIEEARKAPNIAVWQQKIQPLVKEALPALEAEAQQLLQQAYQRAAEQDFSGALALIKQIPQETPTGAKIQPKLAEYRKKLQTKAESLLQQAYRLAAMRDFEGALQYLAQIPEDAPAYEQAQLKIAEYFQKQNFQEEVERQIASNPNLPKAESPFHNLPRPTKSPKASGNLNPGNQLKETSPKPVKQTKPKAAKQTARF